MVVAIIGSRTFTDKEFIYTKLNNIFNTVYPKLIVSGGAKGPDTIGVRWATEMNIPVKEFIPDWTTYGKRAGFIRNTLIINEADTVIAFWDGLSKGTLDSINKARKTDKNIEIIKV